MATSISNGFRHPLGSGVLTEAHWQDLITNVEDGGVGPAPDGIRDGYYLATEYGSNEWLVNESGVGHYSHHLGEDWNGDDGEDGGDPVFAASNGTIGQIGYLAGLGNYITIVHDLPYEITVGSITTSQIVTLYAHLQNDLSGGTVTVDGVILGSGSVVSIGQQIGNIGSSGGSWPDHLHFEIRLGTQYTDADGYNISEANPLGWVDPTDFINAHRTFAPPPVFTTGDDYVTLTTAGGTWHALGGNDIVEGTSGSDTIYGDAGNDAFIGMGGKDIFYGGANSDSFVVLADDDFEGDTYNGGASFDFVVYSDSIKLNEEFVATNHGSITVNLTTGKDNYGKTYVAVECVVAGFGSDTITGNSGINYLYGARGADKIFGLAGIDYLFGGGGNDTLRGGIDGDWLYGDTHSIDSVTISGIVLGVLGNDFLYGEDGADHLIGGAGYDTMTGGIGADEFIFEKVAEIGKLYGARDIIKDFRSDDTINLRAIDTVAGGVDDAFKFLAAVDSQFTGLKGQLRWSKADLVGTVNDKTYIDGDMNGDKIPDFTIELTGLINLNIYDFIL